MEQEDLYVGENGVIKNAFHQNKKPININEVDIKKIISDKKSYGSKDSFKYFIGYTHKGSSFPSPLCIKLPQMNGYSKYCDENNEYVNLLVNDKEMLKNILKYGIKLKVY